MGAVAQACGVGHEFKHGGERYVLHPETPEMIGQFEVWLEGQAWATAKRARKYLKPAELEKLFRNTGRDIASGVYSYGGEYYATAVWTMDGFRQRLLLAIRPDRPDADEELVAGIADDRDRERFADLIRLMKLRDGVTPDDEDDDDADDAAGDSGE